MGAASNRQEEAIASSWNLPNKKTTRLINCVVCTNPRGGRPGYDSDQGRKFMFPYLTNTVCGRGLLTYLQNCILIVKMHEIWSVDSQ